VLVLILLAQAFSRPSYYVVPMTLAPLSLLGGVLFARFLPTRR
jgi:multisubunit Na+/H+ antiporter MnhF subunit